MDIRHFTAATEIRLLRADDKPYGDVKYADPGYQKDGKKRYPIDTEEHIRAAWNYINKEHNGSQYTAAQLSSIKGRIVSAWKSKIDSKGPPSARSLTRVKRAQGEWLPPGVLDKDGDTDSDQEDDEDDDDDHRDIVHAEDADDDDDCVRDVVHAEDEDDEPNEDDPNSATSGGMGKRTSKRKGVDDEDEDEDNEDQVQFDPSEGVDEYRSVEGYAAVFNSNSEDLGGFVERISPKAFKRSLADKSSNIVMLWGHDQTQPPVGSTRSGSLDLRSDSKGLKFRLDASRLNSQQLAAVSAGEMRMSFGFTVLDDDWAEKDGSYVRTLKDVDLVETSLVISPAYQGTSAGLRSVGDLDEARHAFSAFKRNLTKYQTRRVEQKLQVAELLGKLIEQQL